MTAHGNGKRETGMNHTSQRWRALFVLPRVFQCGGPLWGLLVREAVQRSLHNDCGAVSTGRRRRSLPRARRPVGDYYFMCLGVRPFARFVLWTTTDTNSCLHV